MFMPKSLWVPPTGNLPDLRGLEIGLDTETKDGGLDKEKGPGWVYNDGYLLGVSVAWNNQSIYVPIRHPDTENRELGSVICWVEDLLRNNRVVFFNIMYDMGWLLAEGCKVWPEKADDAGTMARLLDEDWPTYNLDDCCAREGFPGKDERLLDDAAAAFGIVKRDGSIKHGLWKIPARYVGPYAEQDAVATLQLGRHLRNKIQDEHLEQSYKTEMALVPVLHKMRERGIRISTKAGEKARADIRVMTQEELKKIKNPWRRTTTIDDLRSPTSLAQIFDLEGISYPRTLKTRQPSFTKEWLESNNSDLAGYVRKARQLEDLGEKFIGNYILGFEHRGRIHAEIKQLGAKTTRFSYANPPLQQMPSRDPELAPIIRGLFYPEDGEIWGAPDYSQQEPRLSVHYAHVSAKHAQKLGIRMDGTEDAIAYYRDKGPDADFHQMVAEMTGKPRRVAKDINLGLFYRMGIEKLARSLGISVADGEILMEDYHGRVPWVRGLAQFCERRAKDFGFIRMIDGTRRHFNLWQPKKGRESGSFARWEQALARWPNQPLERAFAYQAMNGLIQGSAARQTKMAMVECYKVGYIPLVQMHDELDFSFGRYKDALEVNEIMTNVVKLHVPVRVDLEFGTNWGNAKKTWDQVIAMKEAA